MRPATTHRPRTGTHVGFVIASVARQSTTALNNDGSPRCARDDEVRGVPVQAPCAIAGPIRQAHMHAIFPGEDAPQSLGQDFQQNV
jgi:hypothetical protein